MYHNTLTDDHAVRMQIERLIALRELVQAARAAVRTRVQRSRQRHASTAGPHWLLIKFGIRETQPGCETGQSWRRT